MENRTGRMEGEWNKVFHREDLARGDDGVNRRAVINQNIGMRPYGNL